MTDANQNPVNVVDEVPDGPTRALSLFIWKNRLAWFLVVVVSMAGADQATKIWAQSSLAIKTERSKTVNVDGELTTVREEVFVHRESVDVIPQALSFIYRENRAAAFSLTNSIPYTARRPLLLFVSLLAMGLITAWYFRQRRPDGILMAAFSLIVGGAIGNFIDRARLGYVIDWINMYAGFIEPRWPPWPTYNIADSCIVVGATLVIFRTFRPLYPEELPLPNAPKNEGASASAA